MNEQLEFLDVLTIVSFVLQIQNQTRIIGMEDIQNEVNRAVREIHSHLEVQDTKLNEITEKVSYIENNQKAIRNDRMRD